MTQLETSPHAAKMAQLDQKVDKIDTQIKELENRRHAGGCLIKSVPSRLTREKR
jgi:uncharacterized protein YydD (DUF2326 family)